MKISRHELIDTLLQIIEHSSDAARKYKCLSVEELNYKEDPERWSIYIGMYRAFKSLRRLLPS
jgi:hypothetical protein